VEYCWQVLGTQGFSACREGHQELIFQSNKFEESSKSDVYVRFYEDHEYNSCEKALKELQANSNEIVYVTKR